MTKAVVSISFCLIFVVSHATSILVPMDDSQSNHLKAYGLAFHALKKDKTVDWLLNYRGGSFLFEYSGDIRNECTVRGVSFEVISPEKVNAILTEIANPEVNMNVVKLEKAPRIAVYSPKSELITDETDAVILVLDYAEIPYTIIYDEEILKDELSKYDWVHLHHEDFTGQVGRFAWRQSNIMEGKVQEVTAHHLGYAKVSEMKLDVAKKIKAFCAGGGYLFAMCSGAETFDIALAAEGIDIVAMSYDGDDVDPAAQDKLDFNRTFAFENFTLETGDSRRFSDINVNGRSNFFEQSPDYFLLFNYSAKWDIIPTMLNQNHENVIREFFGQTTSFNKFLVKPSVTILGENRKADNVRYIYGEHGLGHWTFYSGHDPEGNPGRGRDRSTDLSLFPHSPGYRLILNNVLFPSAKKKKQKT
ncbi:MAG TPA: asparagine synthetase B [Cyclobacteriaceae bacterium]